MYLFTATFPYGPGESFLEAELPYLAEAFSGVTVLPRQAHGSSRALPPGVELDLSLVHGRWRRWGAAGRGLIDTLGRHELRRELVENRAVLHHPAAWRRMLHTAGRARATRDWILRATAAGRMPTDAVLYSYWLDAETLGAVMARADLPGLAVVSRAHRRDLYANEHTPAYLPFRDQILAGIDAVYTVSDHGASTLQAQWPRRADRIRVARLGVSDPSHDTPPSRDGVLRVVSCSFLVPVKRVDLLLDALICAGKRDPARSIVWSHLGDGPLLKELRQRAEEALPANVEARFLGNLEHQRVLDFYRTYPVDVFVNVSASEGVPVSIMEAQSFGIPVIATAVGGTPEIVNDANGCLLPANPGADEIAAAVTAFHGVTAEVLAKRGGSKRRWRERYHAEANYREFNLSLLGHGRDRRTNDQSPGLER